MNMNRIPQTSEDKHLGFSKDVFKEKHTLPPPLILSGRSMCVYPHLGMIALNLSYFYQAYVELRVGCE
jgi:hypothetical protein